jgi:hypothetical protein
MMSCVRYAEILTDFFFFQKMNFNFYVADLLVSENSLF